MFIWWKRERKFVGEEDGGRRGAGGEEGGLNGQVDRDS